MKMNRKEVGLESTYWNHILRIWTGYWVLEDMDGPVTGFCGHDDEPSVITECGECLPPPEATPAFWALS
jgi:hypothetical protein